MTILPWPGRRNTRATALLRRPVPRFCVNAAGISSPVRFLLLRSQRHRLLSLVRMLGSGVYLEFGHHLLAELVFRQHTGYGKLHHPDGAFSPHPGGALFLESTRVAGVVAIHLVAFLG